MSASPHPRTVKVLQRVEELMSSPITRKDLYSTVAKEMGGSVASIKMISSRAGLTCSEHNLKHAFSMEDELALVNVCIIKSRQGNPFTIPAFIRLASLTAGKTKREEFFTHSFVKKFVKRHSDALRLRKGKVTSPARCIRSLLQKTEEFIELLNSSMASKMMNQNNIVVFDESVIGDCVSQCKRLGERTDFGGNNVNVYETRESALGSYIPFSLPDGSTPFRVFIVKTGKKGKGFSTDTALVPKKEKGILRRPHRLFLSSETGFISTEHFEIIMAEFASWWQITRPGLDCFMISDNLRVHCNKRIVATAMSKGIHMLNIMPGSSHWFQVHDQQPFGLLKKKMAEKKSEFSGCFSPVPKVRRQQLMCMFYEAEACAFEPQVVRKAFADVGLSPWNPERIHDVAQKHSATQSLEDESERTQEIMEKSIALEQEKKAELDKMLSELEPAEVKSVKKVTRPRGRPKKAAPAPQKQVHKRPHSSASEIMDGTAPKPRKRQRKA